ncbi:3-oxo-5-alpha-steroid 4-dehydrogenase [Beauveria brongniartii RCEF 3172]|uniref:Polyprenal reductase n=1 Tax=Beauveria brongniartii RCEF 3172 TaxID=1081107 RepID=A0A167HTI9_9HYPO|nr:3-oxo-5-alpha-steroid 4-dehydrogenase [Beauveria brongniartii RCEF 3172]
MPPALTQHALQHLLLLRDRALAQPPSQWCQVFFLGAAGGLMVMQALPATLRGLLMDYGARGTDKDAEEEAAQQQQQQQHHHHHHQKQTPPPPSGLKRLVAAMTSAGQVPHAWFWHFYLLSMAGSAFWAWQFWNRGGVLRALAERQQQQQQRATDGSSSEVEEAEAMVKMERELGKVFAAWIMMALQGTRRLYESMFVMKTGSGSSMWVVHWVVGLSFYAVMSISVWIEGSDAILASWETQEPARILASRVPAAMALYFWAWTKQHECHAHLARLKKYTLPSEGLYRFLVCPHYTCECLIYLAIAVAAAPTGRWVSGPVMCGLAFVVANLGATAIGTRRWYMQKFGADAVASRWTMIPFVF